jgi:hypothetical protein
MNPSDNEALEAYKEVKPEIRAALAFVLFLRFASPDWPPERCFVLADQFLTLYEQRRTA